MKYKPLLAAPVLLFSALAHSSPLIYQPINPNFGGNPLNGSYLMSNAQAQNSYKDPALNDALAGTSSLDNLTELLQSNLLSDMLTNPTPGQSISTKDYSVKVQGGSSAGQLVVLITDKKTGQTSTIEVNGRNTN
ncbi:curli assembly protein CsgF [Plesiomonas shigelloides]|uniref:curli assembly protein CsgF n=1 Tax=Plesiomonas shigelloides TaxID=703 RepID=UPI0012620FEB|nr:curli assembly protein CsgF [Plesiomonas shigelloides]KAB7665998.1 curli production assembly protein CsgF [Plesiomonas shigelloides]